MLNEQITLADINDEYAAFVEKFKPKKTTDDCYTPPNVYEAVLAWVVKEYGIDPEKIVRPFWPGGDYEREEYPEGCTVVDNPPFSIITPICNTYVAAGVKFFLFAPYLTNLGICPGKVCHVITDTGIRYENGADVNTSFVTNLDDLEVRTAPGLRRAIVEADNINRHQSGVKTMPKYEYPPNVLMVARVGRFSKYGIDYRLRRKDCFFVRALDEQRGHDKAMFGGGFLLSEKAAAEKAAAEKAAAEKAAAKVWELSDRERMLINMLGGGEP